VITLRHHHYFFLGVDYFEWKTSPWACLMLRTEHRTLWSTHHRHCLCGIYRVARNKQDYLLLLSKFCISITIHVSMIMYV